MARTLTIHRESKFLGCAVPCSVILDGGTVGSLRNGASITLTIDEAPHDLKFWFNSTTKPGFAAIPAGSGDLKYSIAAKMGFPYGGVQVKAEGRALSAGPARNELDDYRPGGSRYIPTDKGYEGSKDVGELEEFIISRVAGFMFAKYLDIENNPLAETARKNGTTLRAIELRFEFTEGVLKGTVTGYSSRDRRSGSRLFTLPNDLTFDWLLSDAGCDRTATGVHNLARMRDMTLSRIAECQPDAVLNGDVLRTA